MLPQDYNHPIFTAANTSELQQRLQHLEEDYEPEESNQSFRILQRLQKLARAGKGLRLHTRYGLGSYSDHNILQGVLMLRVLFDGDVSTTGVSLGAIKTFWFEME